MATTPRLETLVEPRHQAGHLGVTGNILFSTLNALVPAAAHIKRLSCAVVRTFRCWLPSVLLLVLASCKARQHEPRPATTRFHIGETHAAAKPLPASVEETLRELREDGSVRSELVGDHLDKESPFHKAARTLLPSATPDLLASLAADRAPAVRALAFWGYALQRNPEALSRYFCARDIVQVHPGGCVSSSDTLGEVAQSMAFVPHWLLDYDRIPEIRIPAPLFDEQTRVSLVVQVLAVDGCELSFEAPNPFESDLTGWNLARLRAVAPRVPEQMLVKALALREPERGRPLLSCILNDEAASPAARLTAASGLTLTLGNAAVLHRNAAFLDRFDGDSVLDMLELRERFEAFKKSLDELEIDRKRRLDQIIQTGVDDSADRRADLTIEALAIRSPLVLELAFDSPPIDSRAGEVHHARYEALRWIAKHFDDHENCWDVYRDAPFAMERWLNGQGPGSDLLKVMTEDQVAWFRAKVSDATARRDADTGCR